MFGIDEWIAGLSEGGSIAIVVLVATLLGLRHAADPDHIAAITTLVASGKERATRSAARLGAWWGLGHAVTLVAFGLPILLAQRYLPERAQQGAETAVAALIVFLAIRLLLRWRHGMFSVLLSGGTGGDQHHHGVRTRFGAFGIGLVHGMGGSAGVGVLLLAAVPDETVAIASLLVLALFTAVSMTIVTTGFGATLSVPAVARSAAGAAPALGVASLAFGVWYAAAAWSLAPYPF
jgi:high-affinity nickel permease